MEHENRSILLETLTYEKNLCRSCRTSSGDGISICQHRMYYKNLHDPFDCAILFDFENRPVMMKIYETHPVTGEFTHLLKEEWNVQTVPELLQSHPTPTEAIGSFQESMV